MKFTEKEVRGYLVTKWLEMNPDYELLGLRKPKEGEDYLTFFEGTGFGLLTSSFNFTNQKRHVVKKKVQLKKGQIVRMYNKDMSYATIGFFVRTEDGGGNYFVGSRAYASGVIGGIGSYSTKDWEITPLEEV